MPAGENFETLLAGDGAGQAREPKPKLPIQTFPVGSRVTLKPAPSMPPPLARGRAPVIDQRTLSRRPDLIASRSIFT
jgi:hypothetical protein